MTMSKEIREVLPDPERLVEGLRDTGYQFNTAIADIVDNSIAACAKNIAVELRMDPRGAVTLKIFDDGVGMNKEGLVDAMRYGAKARPTPKSLGKFGLGLKTASTAFSRRLSVISRPLSANELVKATWDLDEIKQTGKWNLVVDDCTLGEMAEFNKFIPGGIGTFVMWDRVDRLLKSYESPNGGPARKALEKISDSLHQHFATVYQRFLDPADTRESTISLRLNGRPVEPWDPFCQASGGKLAQEKTMQVELADGSDAEFSIRAFILPRKEEFATDEEGKNARITNTNQGIFIYRENRMIHGPTWLGMFSKEPHLSLLRVEFSFDHRLDEAFQIDIKKSQILLDEGLHQHVLDFLTPVRRAAGDIYRTGRRKITHATSAGAHNVSNRNIAGKSETIPQPGIGKEDPARGEATITNPRGTVRLKLKIAPATSPVEIYVQTVPSIDDGLLWQPAVLSDEDGVSHAGVQLNTGHPYYAKIYIPNLSAGVTIQGMDALFWGLCIAELNCVTEATKRVFEDIRYEVSRTLKKLVEDLPEPDLSE